MSPCALRSRSRSAGLFQLCCFLFIEALLFASAGAWAAGGGSIAGRVVAGSGEPVAGAEVLLVALKRRVETAADGGFRFESVPPGTYVLEADSLRFGHGIGAVVVTADAEVGLEITIDITKLQDQIVVSAASTPQEQLEMSQPVTVLSEEELDFRRQGSLGETLSSQPGVTSTYFGPGASRPIIRGLGGDRVRMLSDGLGSADASNVSPDHAVSLEPLSAERIEVLRGPSTLLYGSTAIGGAVNVLPGKIPEYPASTPIGGSVQLSASTVADERAGAIDLEGGAGSFAYRIGYQKRETDDYEIPGFAEADHGEGEDEVEGLLENSAVEAEAGNAGFSFITEKALVGVAVSGYDTLYGVPGGHHHEEGEGGEEAEEEEEAGVRIDLEQRRIDLKGEILQPFGIFRGAKLRLGRGDYEHRELEGEEIGTTFTNESWEGRFELVQKEMGFLSGSFGAQAGSSEFEAIGEEAFVPPSVTDTLAVFFFEELKLKADRFHLQFGGRYEQQDLAVDSDELPDRDFSGTSASLGFLWHPSDGYALTASVARSERLPTATELYADGPHVATGAFERGDPNLDKESSLGVDVSLRKTAGRFTATLNLFANRFDDYVFERFTGEEEDGLPVIQFAQEDAEFVGAEVEALVELFETDAGHLDLKLSADTVRAELSDSGEPLPRIPARRYGLGFSYHRERFRAYAEAQRVEDQDRVSENEMPTEGYTLVNAGASYRFFAGDQVFDVVLTGRNLGDEEARLHTSFLKEVAPLPGRDLGLALRWSF